ncbi:MAG: ATP-binding protein [Candidatus Obscuribacter sp.]|nr:hypothetical protein [Candidatus Melainabacteria bacterium]MDX1986951.1 ATP-binding protein [Candidatus Obscuribacter sp.]
MSAELTDRFLPRFFLLLTALAALIASCLTPLDSRLCEFLGLPVCSDLMALLLRTGLACATMAGLLMTALKVRDANRLIVYLQITALSLLLQWWLNKSIQMLPMPSTLAVLFLLAVQAGGAYRLLTLRLEKAAADQYGLLLKGQEVLATKLALLRQEEAERRLLASDLHDQVLQDLKQLKAALNELSRKVDAADLAPIETLIDSSTTQVRAVMENLFPSVLENLGFKSALSELLRQTTLKGGLRAHLTCPEEVPELSAIEKLLLFRIMQEVLNNIVKHAQAGQVTLMVETQPESLKVTVKDDGKGLPCDYSTLTRMAEERGSRGLRYIEQRADLLQAAVAWQSVGGGTTFTLVLPLVRKQKHHTEEGST